MIFFAGRDFSTLDAVYLHVSVAVGQLPVGRVHAQTFPLIIGEGLEQWRKDLSAIPSLRGTPVITTDEFIRSEVAPLISSFQRVRWVDQQDSVPALPRRGTPTVIVSMNQNCSNACEQMYAAYRHLYDVLAPQGVTFILLARTQGYFRNGVRLSVEAEADTIRAYVRDRLRLPGILGVEETDFETLADGRRVPRPSRNVLSQSGDPLAFAGPISFPWLVTKSGVVLKAGNNFFGAALGEERGDIGVLQFIQNQMNQ